MPTPAPLYGRDAYEADVLRRPLYHDGTPRKTWDRLDDLLRWSWERHGPAQDEEGIPCLWPRYGCRHGYGESCRNCD